MQVPPVKIDKKHFLPFHLHRKIQWFHWNSKIEAFDVFTMTENQAVYNLAETHCKASTMFFYT